MALPDVTLRELVPLRALRLRGFRDDPRSFGYSFEESSKLPLAHAEAILRREARSPDDFVLGAHVGDVLVGMIGLQREVRAKRAHRAVLWGMHVVAEARRRGLARRLTSGLLARALTIEGLERLNLTVISHNQSAVDLYRSFGFETWGVEPRAMRLDGAYHDECSMGLELHAATSTFHAAPT